jgi:DNA polymerase (family 10)
VAELLRLPGVGPVRARHIQRTLGVRSLADLRKAAARGKLAKVPGIGPKGEATLRAALAGPAPAEERTRLATAAGYAEALREHLLAVKGVERVEVAGSYRRRQETVGDLDLLVTCRDGAPVVRAFVSHPAVKRVEAEGPTRAAVRLASGLHVDLRVLPPESFGAGLYYFTGSKAHNIALRRRAVARGLKLNEYGVFRGTRRVAGRTEEEVLAALGLPWIPPELREDRGEIAAAEGGTLPRLVRVEDLRGDLQCHTTDSDGRDTLRAMAEAAEALGHEYLAVTDHSPAVRVAQGMDAAGFARQRGRIDRLNAKLRRLTLLAGVEVDVLPDGTLDLDDRSLARFDIVLAAVHSRFDLPPRQQTARLLAAIRHPAVRVLAHPTARLIGRRAPMRYDLEAVARAAAEAGVWLEIDAQPERLDLNDVMAHVARAAGARFVISTDAHAAAELRFLPFGVDQARRAWLTRADVMNTLPLDRLLKAMRPPPR